MVPPSKLVVKECIVCYQNTVHDDDANNDLAVVELKSCKCRRTCRTCFATYLRTEISEGRVSLTCPECPELLHPADVQKILAHRSQSTQHIAASSGAEIIDATFLKYEEFMVRRVLAREEPDARWCPAPNCNYAVIANGCASCPRLECRREGCGTAFCYHCKQLWHPDKPCNLFSTAATIFSLSTNRAGTTSTAAQTAAAGNNIILQTLPSSLLKYADPTANLGLIKPCPTCQALIAKTEDGSCNHMTCAMCGTDFCWLCLKPVSDLHFLSPSGCTFWGKRPWSRKKKVWCQVGTLIGAPVGIALVAGLALPAILVGVPVFTGRKIYRKMEKRKKWKRNMAVTLGVVGAAVGAPLAAVFAVGVGVPCMVAYVYGVVPFALVRNSFGGNSSSNNNNAAAAAAAAAAGELRNSTVTTTNLESAAEEGPPQKSARIIAVDEHGHAVILNTIAATSTSSSMAAAGMPTTPTIKNNNDAKQSAAVAEVPPPSAKKIPFFSHLLRRSNRSDTTNTHGGEMSSSSSSSNKPHATANVDTTKTDAARRSSNHPDQLNIDNGNSCGCRCRSRVEQTTSSIPCEATTPVLVSSVSSDLVSASAAHASSSEVICTCCGCGGGGGDRCSSVADHNRSRRSLSRCCDGQQRCHRQQSTTTTTTASSSTTVDDTHSCSIISTNVSLDAAVAGGGCSHSRHNNNTAGCCSGSMQGMSSMTGKKRCCSNSTTNAAVMTTTTTSVTRHDEEPKAAISPIAANSSSNDNASLNGLAGSLACAKCGVAGAQNGLKIAHVTTTTTTTTTRDSQSYYAGCLDHHRRRRCDIGSNHDDVKSQVMVASAELACHSVKHSRLGTNTSYEPKPNDAAAAGVLMMIQPSSSSMTSSSAHTHSSSSNMVRKARAGDSVSVTALSRDDGVSVNEDIVGSGGGGGVGAGGIFRYDNEILSVGSGKSSKKSYFK